MPPPDRNMEMITSSNEVRNASKAAVTIENFNCGKVISKKALILVDPRLWSPFK